MCIRERVLADRKAAARRLEQVQAEAGSWEDKARLAISKGREDLARAALQEKRAIEEEIALVEAELRATDEHIAQLNGGVARVMGRWLRREGLLARVANVWVSASRPSAPSAVIVEEALAPSEPDALPTPPMRMMGTR